MSTHHADCWCDVCKRERSPEPWADHFLAGCISPLEGRYASMGIGDAGNHADGSPCWHDCPHWEAER